MKEMVFVIVSSSILVFIFLTLWLKERRRSRMESIAYGFRTGEDHTEGTKTNITLMDSGFREAMSRLEDIGEVAQDEWGKWVWLKSGKPVGEILEKQE